MKSIIIYLLSIFVANLSFTYLPMLELPLGLMLPPGTFLVGFIFVFRDYAQRAVGNWVYAAMAAGVVLSYVMADPFVAIASAVAFAISEVIDALVFSVSKKPLKDRILLSSAASTPIDSAVFLVMIGFFDWLGLVVMIVSKMIGAIAVWAIAKE